MHVILLKYGCIKTFLILVYEMTFDVFSCLYDSL